MKQSFINGGNVKWDIYFWKTVWQFLKLLNIKLPYDSSISRYIPKRIENICTHTHKGKKKETLCINVQSSITYKSQNIESVQMSTNWRMDKQKGVYLYNGILLCNKREWRTDTDYNMD